MSSISPMAMQMINIAQENGEALHGAIPHGMVACKRFNQRRDHAHLSHKPAYRFQWYLNGKRIAEARAKEILANTDPS